MATAKFDIKKIEIRAEVTRPFYAYVGATDLAVEYVRTAVADVQKQVRKIELAPRALGGQVASKVTTTLDETTSTVTDTYVGLAERGEDLVVRIRKQESTQRAAKTAGTTKAKAKSVKTQAAKATDKTATTAKKQGSAAKTTAKRNADSTVKTASSAAKQTTSTAKKNADSTVKTASSAAKETGNTAAKTSAPARSSAKATTTSAAKTAGNTTQAVTDAAKKLGD